MKKNFTETAEDKAMKTFAEVLINHLETVEVGNWEKPWVFNRGLQWPRNIDGREYASGNALILMMHTQQNGFTAPIYATFERFRRMNFVEGDKYERLKDADGNPLPLVKVNKGAGHMPVVKTVFNPVHKKTKDRIPYATYMALSEEEKMEYNVFPKKFIYQVFNIDQTNLKEARPELYAELTNKTKSIRPEKQEDGGVTFQAVDVMVAKDLWQCPIKVCYSSSAYYAPNKDMIVIPEKPQFKFAESFYGTLFHECAHSTGAKHRYDRDMGGKDSKKYAKEELVAELTAALVSSRYGLEKNIKSDSLPYLKSWLGSLKEEPEFIKGLLNDVKKASSQLIRRIDFIQNRIDELKAMGIEEPETYPEFAEINPITGQPVGDPAKYYVKEEVEA